MHNLIISLCYNYKIATLKVNYDYLGWFKLFSDLDLKLRITDVEINSGVGSKIPNLNNGDVTFDLPRLYAYISKCDNSPKSIVSDHTLAALLILVLSKADKIYIKFEKHLTVQFSSLYLLLKKNTLAFVIGPCFSYLLFRLFCVLYIASKSLETHK